MAENNPLDCFGPRTVKQPSQCPKCGSGHFYAPRYRSFLWFEWLAFRCECCEYVVRVTVHSKENQDG